MTLAICLALRPVFLLLDEPTSALDHEAAVKVERLLRDSSAACIWVTHEDAQVSRVGGRALQLPLGTEVPAMTHLHLFYLGSVRASFALIKHLCVSHPTNMVGSST